jgi:hypothetical protein
MMRFLCSKPRPRSSWIALAGIICASLVLMIGMVQAVHSHPSGHPDPDCALCVTAHQAIQVVALVTLDATPQPVEHVLLEPELLSPSTSFFFRLDCRPPPAESASA